MGDGRLPPVSIGLPVYNGEKYLEDCIASVLAQTFEDFQLFISDDASTDRSADICRDFAACDPRIIYHRQPRNAGMSANFQRLFEYSKSPHFKWMNQDDLITPDFLAASLAALKAKPDAVLCYSAVDIIGPDGAFVAHDPGHLPAVEGDKPSARFRAMALGRLENGRALSGLIQADALRRCLPFRRYATADIAVLVGLVLRGPFVYVPRPIYRVRDHPDRYSRKVYYDRSAVARAWGSRRSTRFGLHFWFQIHEYARIVSCSGLGAGDRLRCYGHLLTWFGVKHNQIGLAMDLIALIDPRLEVALRRAKHRFVNSDHSLAV